MNEYKVKSPVLFLIFNRPDTTKQVFERIKAVRPSRIYIAADGPREGRIEETILCAEARQFVGNIDWDCEVKTLFREINLGCKMAVSTAINWFFENEKEGIILEDDCLPDNSFFYFCDSMLDTYRSDQRVRHITGTNLQMGRKWGEASYYFSEMTNIWGWATWRRVWDDYDRDLKRYSTEEVAAQLQNIFSDSFLVDQWMKIFQDLKDGKIDTWDYQLGFTNYLNHGLSVNPNVNLISNIGFRSDATHTYNSDSEFSELRLDEITHIIHPKYFVPQKDADYSVFEKEFQLVKKRQKHFSYRRRLKRWIKSTFTSR